jgi:putative oxidoreductase
VDLRNRGRKEVNLEEIPTVGKCDPRELDFADGEEFMIRILTASLALANRLDWLAPLLMRLFVGYFFFETGWGKIHNLDAFAERFAGWGIPYPYFNAVLSAYTELVGGALIVVGFLTRIVAIPLIINMLVAIVTVKIASVSNVNDFVELDEPLYLLSFFWLMLSGPGVVSLDFFLARAVGIRDWAWGSGSTVQGA